MPFFYGITITIIGVADELPVYYRRRGRKVVEGIHTGQGGPSITLLLPQAVVTPPKNSSKTVQKRGRRMADF
jgi:hypothetical protein